MSSITNNIPQRQATFCALAAESLNSIKSSISASFSSLCASASATSKIYLPIDFINETILFISEFRKNPLLNGSIFPSSQKLTEKIIKYIPQNSEVSTVARRYLEVGAGTGPFTEGIVKRLDLNDTFDIVELNPVYCELLKDKFKNHSNVHIHERSITDWNPEEPYDVVISGLPLNGFSPEMVEDCLNVFKKVTKENGIVSYFEYPRFSNLCLKYFSIQDKPQHAKLEKVLEIKEQFFKTYGFDSEIVEINFPTAKVLHFKMRKPDDAPIDTTPTVSDLSDASGPGTDVLAEALETR